jgi:hypothetical protein
MRGASGRRGYLGRPLLELRRLPRPDPQPARPLHEDDRQTFFKFTAYIFAIPTALALAGI